MGLVNVFEDAAVHFLCTFTRRCSHSLHVELMVESRLLLLEVPPSLVELVIPDLWGLLTGGSVRRGGFIFRGALVGSGGVDGIGLLLEDEALTCWVIRHWHLLSKRRPSLHLKEPCDA
jgi:hypothetical protein